MTDLALIADDLTGAADSGVPFAMAGFSTAIPFDTPRREAADVLAFSTESRDVPVREAERRVRGALTAVFGRDGSMRPAWIYKKMDSVLRGHPVEELLITMQIARVQRVVVAPALPSQGRTTVGGVIFDHGVPLTETAMGKEHGRENLVHLFQRASRTPVRSISLGTVRGSARDLRNALSAPGSWIAVADAETEADLDAIATVGIAAGIRVFSGSAGLTNVLARRLPIHQLQRPPAVQARSGPVLVVAGSRHAATSRQLRQLDEAGAVVIRLDQAHVDEEEVSFAELRTELQAALSGSAPVVVTADGLGPAKLGGAGVSRRLAEAVAIEGLHEQVAGLVMTGGDVAAAVCRQLGVKTIWLRGEVSPAIPWGTVTAGAFAGLPIVTKAGSFGGDTAMVEAVRLIEGLRG